MFYFNFSLNTWRNNGSRASHFHLFHGPVIENMCVPTTTAKVGTFASIRKRSEANVILRIGKEQTPLFPMGLLRNRPGRKTKLVCSRIGCQDTLHETTKCNESYLGKLLGCKQVQSATRSLQSQHPLRS